MPKFMQILTVTKDKLPSRNRLEYSFVCANYIWKEIRTEAYKDKNFPDFYIEIHFVPHSKPTSSRFKKIT